MKTFTIDIEEGFDGKMKQEKITETDLIKYFKHETKSISGMRRLGNLFGDWRMIDNIARQLWGGFE